MVYFSLYLHNLLMISGSNQNWNYCSRCLIIEHLNFKYTFSDSVSDTCTFFLIAYAHIELFQAFHFANEGYTMFISLEKGVWGQILFREFIL